MITYDTWYDLLLLITPDKGEDWPTIQPTEDPTIVDVTWPDGSSSILYLKNGRWKFPDEPEIQGYSSACGYKD